MADVDLFANPVSTLPASAGSPGPIIDLTADAITTLTAVLGAATLLSGLVNFYGYDAIGTSELGRPTRFIPEITADIFAAAVETEVPATVTPMRVRKLDANGDMCFGHGQKDFWRNVPEGPAQCAYTRLVFWYGEWFLDPTDGTPWNTQVLGKHTAQTRDPMIILRVSQTKGVEEVTQYSSSVNRETREFDASIVINTIYGPAKIEGPL